MINQIKTKLTGDRLYFLSFGLFLITSILSTSFYYKYFMGVPYMRIQMLGAVLLIAYECCVNGRSRQNWLALLICGVLFTITYRASYYSTQRQIVLMFAYIYCAREIPFAKIARFALNVSIVTVCVIVFSGYLGIIDNIAAFKSGRVREYLGFRYALNLPGILLNMTALWIYLRKERITIPGALGWAVVNWLVYDLTDSRISFFIAEALIAAALVMRFWPKIVDKIKPLWWLAASSFGVCGVVSLIMTAVYDSSLPWMRKLNSMLESRLRLGKLSLDQYGINLFGQKIEWLGNGLDAYGNGVTGVYTYVDCLYVKVLQRYGIVFAVAMAFLLCWSMYKLYKQREYHILLISATVAVHCVLDDLSFSLHYNTFWIAMGMALICPSMLNWNGRTTRTAPPEGPKTE